MITYVILIEGAFCGGSKYSSCLGGFVENREGGFEENCLCDLGLDVSVSFSCACDVEEKCLDD